MKDQNKTKKELINELAELRQRVDELEALEKELRQTGETLRENEGQLELIADSLPVLISYVDSEQRYHFNNKAYERWFGYHREEVYGKHIKEVLGESAYEVIRQYIETALSGQEVSFERWTPYKNGGTRYISATYIPHFSDQGQVKGFFALVDDLTEHKGKDEELERYRQSLEKLIEGRTAKLMIANMELQREITERKSAEVELLRARADWENIFQAIGHPTLILDPEHKVIVANRVATKAAGTTGEDLRGKKCYEIFHGADQPPEGCPLEKISVSGHLETVEMEMEAFGGFFLVSCTPVFDEKGVLRSIIHIATDITERKRLEKILEKERQELKLIIDTSPIIIFYKDKEGKFIRVNKTFTEALKKPEEDFMGKTVFDLYSAKIAQGMTDDDHEVLTSVRPKLNIIEQYESASGIRWVQTDKIPICDKNGIPVGLIGFAQDITERKRAEDTLRKSEANYRELADSIGDVFFAMDKDLKYTYWNKASENLIGIPAQDAIGKSLYDFFPKIRGTRAEEVYLEVLRTQQAQSFINQFRVGDKIFVFDISAYPTQHGLSVFVKDITEQKRMEDALRESEELFSKIFYTSPVPTSLTTLSGGRFLNVNDIFLHMLGYRREEVIGHTAIELQWWANPADREKLLEMLREHGTVKGLDVKLRSKSGEIRETLASIELIELAGEQTLLGLAQDITEQKRAEEALRESKANLSALIENTNDWICSVDSEHRILTMNKAFKNMIYLFLKIELEEGMNIMECISPKQRTFWTDIHDRALKGEHIFFEDHYGPEGFSFDVEVSVNPIIGGHGAITGASYFARDITERKRAEETLWESQELYRSLFEGVPIGLYRTMPSGEILDANPALVEMLGYPDRESLLVVSLAGLFVNLEDHKRWEALMESEGIVRDFEVQFRRYDGEVIWIRDTCRAVRHDDGQALYHEGAIQDITERKRAEEALRQSEERYRTLFEESRDVIYITTREGKFIDINKSGLELFSYTKKEMMSLSVEEIYFDPDYRSRFQREIERKGFVGDYEIKFRRKNRAVIDCLVTAIVQRANDGSILGYQGIIRDITERKQAEEQLRSSREQLRALSAHLQSIREEERTLIAREIHDELGQDLTGLKMDLSWLIKRLPKNQELDVKKVESMLKLVDTTIQSVRRISTKLRPGVLDDLGLTAAIEWQTQDFQTRTGIECEFSSNLGEIDLDRDRSTTVFRILQETLTNVARHASATRVNIRLNEEAAGLVLIVEDNGRGITEREISDPKSLGLLGMRERALIFGGEVTISGAPGKGTMVRLRIPLQK